MLSSPDGVTKRLVSAYVSSEAVQYGAFHFAGPLDPDRLQL